MDIINSVTDSIDGVLAWFARTSGQTLTRYCDIETADLDNTSLIGYDGSLISVIQVLGNSSLVGVDEFSRLCAGLGNSLQAYMNEGGHKIQFFFERDPDASARLVEAALLPARMTAKGLSLDLSDIFDDQEREIAQWIAHEAVYCVLWTGPRALSPAEQKAALKEAALRDKQSGRATSPVHLNSGFPGLRDRHAAFVNALLSDLGDLRILAQILDAHQAVAAIRHSVDPLFTPDNYRPSLPGDKFPVRLAPRKELDIASIMWPSIASQVFPRDAWQLDTRTIRVGDRIYAPLYMDVPPQDILPFIALFQRTLTSDVPLPWRISFLLEAGGLEAASFSFKAAMASVLHYFSSTNALIKTAVTELRELAKVAAIVNVRICVTTWAPEGELALLRSRTARLAKAVVGWGSTEVRETAGDPLEAFVSTALAIAKNSVATAMPMPLPEVIRMLPITRPASPWASGAMLFTSPDGKLMPFQPGSALQQTWISLFFAGPGSGKSVLMNILHKATCLAPGDGSGRLPRIAILDIGPSSAGFILLMKHALPENMRYLVNHYRLRMTKNNAINPFDTQLGCRFPLPEQRAFLIDFVTMIVTPAETGVAEEGMSNMVGLIVDQMYSELADSSTGKPHRYAPRLDPSVDELLERLGWQRQEDSTWWDVVDWLFQRGHAHEARVAQRFAVPLLSDAAGAARSNAVRDIYEKTGRASADAESLPEKFVRMIQEAVREYPVLTSHTQFEIGDSRITAIDLHEVAQSGGPHSLKRTAIMYMLSAYALTSDFTLTKDNLQDIPATYRTHHNARIHELHGTLKTICFDELHRTGSGGGLGGLTAQIRQRIKVYMREGRKWNLQVMLASQELSDFDAEMISMATNVYIMDAPAEQNVQAIKERFGLSETEMQALRNRIRGPRRGGGTMFARIRMKDGVMNQLLRPPAGPIEMWASSSTAEDTEIRERVFQVLGPVEGRKALAHSYPGGSAKGECEKRKLDQARAGNFDTEHEGGLYAQVAREVCNAWSEKTAKAA